MSSCPIERVFLYKVPAYVMRSFYEIMDSLEETDWKKFASRIIEDQTELRLLEQSGPRARTEGVMWVWMNKNALVGQLMAILRSLSLWRALDVFESWASKYQEGLHAPLNVQPRKLSPPPPYVHPDPDREPQYQKLPPPPPPRLQETTGSLPQTETVTPSELPLPLPGPPPKELLNSSICPSQTLSSRSSSVSSGSLTHSSVQESLVSSNLTDLSSHYIWNFQELLQGTNNFSQSLLIGEGGFGCVYKATMRNTEYAVKRLKQDSELEWNTVKKSFLTEIEKLTCLRHPNIIDLAGYCIHEEEYCLIYLYLPNGSLEDRLHHQGSLPPLSWHQRVNILQGAACGLQFLHTCQPSVIHGDIKSSNILLDQALNPKLGDFGLARFSRYTSNVGKSRTLAKTSTVRGTLAYLPEEYVKMGKLTFELDTYSFGVVLLENLTGRKAIQSNGQSHTKYLKDLVKEEESKEEDDISCVKGASVGASAEDKISRVASRICQHHLDFRVGHCPVEVAQELCLLACRCLGRQKKRPRMVEVFNILKRLQGHLPHPPLGRGHGIGHSPSSFPHTQEPFPPVLELVSSLQGVVLTPEENTDKFTPCGIPGRLSGKGGVQPYSPAIPRYEGQLDSFCSMSSDLSLRTFQGNQNTPVESDESVPDSYMAASSQDPQELHVFHPDRLQGICMPPGTAVRCQNTQSQVPAGNSLPGQSNYCSGLGRSSSSASVAPQAIFVPHPQIVVNPAKQRFVEKLALYDQGKINSLELLSSGILPVGRHSETRGYPEESDDFPS
ncbi:interleukin-1 receptor-associated kinase 1 [Rhinophrynus dorsalis]